MDVLYGLITFASIMAAILAWIAKLRWSKEYRLSTNRLIEVKDAEIRVLQKQLDHLERLNPKALSDWYEGAKQLMVNYTQQLKNQLEVASEKIKELKSEELVKEEKLEIAKKAYDNLSRDYNAIKLSLDQSRLPDFSTVVTSGSTSIDLSEATATKPADVNPLLRRLGEIGIDPKDIKIIKYIKDPK